MKRVATVQFHLLSYCHYIIISFIKQYPSCSRNEHRQLSLIFAQQICGLGSFGLGIS